MIYYLQNFILLVIALGILAVQVFSVIDIIGRPASAFPAEGKRTKKFWLILLIIATMFGVLALPAPIGPGPQISLFFGMLSGVPAILYMVDVRPAISRHSRRRGGGNNRNSGGW